MTYYSEPVLTEVTELDCEAYQAVRNLYRFDIADDCGIDVIAKMSNEDGVYVAHAYVSGADETGTPPEIIDKCLNAAKIKVVEQFEDEKMEQRKVKR